jgi:hypothetical protein
MRVWDRFRNDPAMLVICNCWGHPWPCAAQYHDWYGHTGVSILHPPRRISALNFFSHLFAFVRTPLRFRSFRRALMGKTLRFDGPFGFTRTSRCIGTRYYIIAMYRASCALLTPRSHNKITKSTQNRVKCFIHGRNTVAAPNIAPANISVLNDVFAWFIVP